MAPSSIAPLSSWLLPSEEIGANIFRGQSYSGSGNSRSLIYGTFGDDVMASSGGSTSGVGNPLHAQFSSSMASSPKMPWPDQNAVAVAPGSQFAMNVDTFNNNRPTLPPPEPSPDKSAGLAPFSSKYYDNDDADAVPGLLVGSNMSPLLRLPNSPARLSINPSLPYLQSLPPSYNQPPEYLLEPAINGQDHLNDIAASFKNGSMWGAGMSPSGTGFTGLPSIRGIRSRSNTNDNSILPPMSPALVPGELPHNIPGIWRPMSSATMQNQRSQLRVVTASNVITKRALTTVNSPRDSPRDMSPVRMDSGSPPSSPLARKRGVSHASYVSSSPDSSAPSHSNGGAGSNSSNSTAPPPPPAVAGVWKQHYFTEDVAAYSESLVEEAAKSPKIAV